jgi:type I restriction enzyme S subunit
VTNSKGFVLQEDHFDSKIAGNDSVNHKIVKSGDFAYNPARINVGSIGYFSGEIAIISSLYVCFRTKKSVRDDFFRYLLQLDRTKYQITTFGEGGVRIYLWYELFSLIKCELPCLEEQQKIADFLSAIDKKIELCEKQIADTEKFKKGLLQQMFV